MTENKTEGFGALTRQQSAELASVAVAGAAKAEVEAAYIVAMKQPRKEDDARVKIKQACSNPMFAAKARYSKPVGGNSIVGPSIRLAEEMLRHWGNVLVQQSTIYEDEQKRIVKVVVRDLESNLSYSKELSIEKSVERKHPTNDRDVLGERINTQGTRVFLVRATEDELQNKEAALASKAIRNSGLRLIPDDIVDMAMQTARDTIMNKIKEDPDAAKNVVMDQFGRIGVLPSAIESFLGCPVAQITPAQLAELRDIITAIKDGQATWGEYATPKETGPSDPLTPASPTPPSLAERLKTKAKNGKHDPTIQTGPQDGARSADIADSTQQASDAAVRSHQDFDAEIEQQELRTEYSNRFAHAFGLDANPIYKELLADARVTPQTRAQLWDDYAKAIKAKKVKA